MHSVSIASQKPVSLLFIVVHTNSKFFHPFVCILFLAMQSYIAIYAQNNMLFLFCMGGIIV